MCFTIFSVFFVKQQIWQFMDDNNNYILALSTMWTCKFSHLFVYVIHIRTIHE